MRALRMRMADLRHDGADAKIEFAIIQPFEQSDVALQIVDVQRDAPRALKQ